MGLPVGRQRYRAFEEWLPKQVLLGGREQCFRRVFGREGRGEDRRLKRQRETTHLGAPPMFDTYPCWLYVGPKKGRKEAEWFGCFGLCGLPRSTHPKDLSETNRGIVAQQTYKSTCLRSFPQRERTWKIGWSWFWWELWACPPMSCSDCIWSQKWEV